MSTAGGLTRTYGLQDHFTKPDAEYDQKIDRAQFRRVAGYFRPYRRLWIITFICIAAGSALAVLPPIFVKYILDDAIPQGDFAFLTWMAAAMVLVAIAAGFVDMLQQTLTAKAGQGIMYDLRNELYRHLQKLSLRFYTITRSGEIVSRINSDVAAIQQVATQTLVTIASNIARLAATAVVLFTMNWRLALVAVAVMPAFYIPARVVGRVRRRLALQTQETQAEVFGFLNERMHIGGAILTNIFGQRESDAREFAARTSRLRDLSIRQAIVGRWLFMILSVFSAVGPALIYWYGGYQAIKEGLTPGMLVAFAAWLTLLYRPMVQLATVYADIQAALAVFDRIFEYLDMVPDVQDKPDAVRLDDVRGHIEVKNVSFAYPRPASSENNPDAEPSEQQERFALQDISFEILPGQRVALVGPSGAGKTTITYLVPRFYDPAEGSIRFDGVDLRELAQEDLRRNIGMVTQETFLFHASIRENLLYARPDATMEQIEQACRAANIHQFIAELPDGYDTIVGERGFRLSGGEKQRLSIARALLKNPRVLILDEATSNLDATSEYLIQEALEKLLAGRTSLIIAHRLSTILSADQIIVLERGRIVDKGRHGELLARNGLYAQLFKQQFGKVLSA